MLKKKHLKKVKRTATALTMATAMAVSVMPVSATETGITMTEATEEEIQALFSDNNISLDFGEDEATISEDLEIVEPEILFTNEPPADIDMLDISEEEASEAAVERETTPLELGYDADSIIVEYELEDNSESVEELCKEGIVENGDEGAEELIGTRKNKIVAIDLNDNKTVETAIEEYKNMEGVVNVQPNYVYELDDFEQQQLDIMANAANGSTVQSVSNSTGSFTQWYLDRINVYAAWDFVNKKKHSKVRVCVLDTGCALSHKDLSNNVIDVGLSREIVGIMKSNGTYDWHHNYLYGDGYYEGKLVSQAEKHGTKVIGVLAASGSNTYGIQGVASCYNDDILNVVVVDVFENNNGKKTASTYTIIKGLEYAKSINAKVVNLSLAANGNFPEDGEYGKTCKMLYDNGITVVAAAGNTGKNESTYPSDFEHVISVVGTDQNNQLAKYKEGGSTWGIRKDISAPGKDICSTSADSSTSYGYYDGTSFAAPMVTGTIAMMLSVNPRLSPAQIEKILYSTATDIGEPGKDIKFGNGLLNAGAAVRASSILATGVYPIYNENSVTLGCVHEGGNSNTKYKWEYCVVGTNTWHTISNWSTSEWCTWYPDANTNYAVCCKASSLGDGKSDSQVIWYVNRPQMNAKITGTCATPSGNGVLLGCTANTSKYYTAVYIYSYEKKAWIASSSIKGNSCWYQANGLPKGEYMVIFCTEAAKNSRKLSTFYYKLTI